MNPSLRVVPIPARTARLAIAPGLAALSLLAGCTWLSAAPSDAARQAVEPLEPFVVALEPVVEGLDEPLDIRHAGDGSGRIFVLEHTGAIRIVKTSPDGAAELLPRPFLDLGPDGDGLDRISTLRDLADERGMLGLAFHPKYAENGRFFLHYTRPTDPGNRGAGDESVIAEYRVSKDDPDVASPEERVLMAIAQPQWNHNGGAMAFGPDGFLYLGIGDGGFRADFGPGHTEGLGNGQDLEKHLGKILRIDVDREADGLPYAIPADNPFASSAGPERKEIWAWGMRNPWRFSFDRKTGRLFCGDVGQDKWEEIQIVVPGNHGWRRMEGFDCFNPETDCDDGREYHYPIHVYGHDVEGGGGLSVTGGYVYRGSKHPGWDGLYFFGDHASGRVWTLAEGADGKWSATERLRVMHYLPTFGEDEAGELYTVNYFQGHLLRLVPAKPGEAEPVSADEDAR